MHLKCFTTLKSYCRLPQLCSHESECTLTDILPLWAPPLDWFTTLKSHNELPAYNSAHTALNSHWLTSYHFELQNLNALQLCSHNADCLTTTLLTQLWIHTAWLLPHLSSTTWLNLECSFPSMSLPWKSPNQNIPTWIEHLHYTCKATETNLKWEKVHQHSAYCLSPYQRSVNNKHLHSYSHNKQVFAWHENVLLFKLKICLTPLNINNPVPDDQFLFSSCCLP
jgi:hypothetical protein